jgi:hypothetical protein
MFTVKEVEVELRSPFQPANISLEALAVTFDGFAAFT